MLQWWAGVVGWSVPTGADEEGRGESYLPISPPLANSPTPEAPGGPTVNIQTYLALGLPWPPISFLAPDP